MRVQNPEIKVSYCVFDVILVTLAGIGAEIFSTVGPLLEELGWAGDKKYRKMPRNDKLLLKQILGPLNLRQPFFI